MKFKKQATLPLHIDDHLTIEFTCHHVISNTDEPRILQQLFNGSLFHVTHPTTQEQLPVMYPCAYIDTDEKFIVFFNPEEAISHDELDPKLFEGLPHDVSDYTLRQAHYLSDFYEKLNILDYGLRDTEVECVKFLTHTLFTEQFPNKQILNAFFFEHNNEPSFAFVTKDGQETTAYRQELVTLVNERVHTLDLPKGKIHLVTPQWAIQALALD